MTLLLGAAALGCGDAEPDDEPVLDTPDPLNGTAIIDSSCNSVRGKIEDVMSLAANAVKSDKFAQCLQQATFSWVEGASAEQIIAQLRENKSTSVDCIKSFEDKNVIAAAPVNSSKEQLTFSINTLLSVSGSADLAATVLHEIAHNKGYSHPLDKHSTSALWYPDSLDYSLTVPQQVYRCAQVALGSTSEKGPHGRGRNTTINEATLTPVGGAGGNGFERSCPAGRFASGLQVRAGALIDAVALSCRPADKPDGSSQTTSRAGGSGGTSKTLDCGANKWLVGVQGRFTKGTKGVIEQLAPVCMHASRVQVYASPANEATLGESAGGSSGLSFKRFCPVGMVVRSVVGRSGAYVDSLALQCKSIYQLEKVNQFTLGSVGYDKGTTTLELCPGRSVMTGLTYQTGAVVDRLGGVCHEVATTCPSSGCYESRRPYEFLIASHGGTGGKVAQDKCAPDEALVGIQIRLGNEIESVGGTCANVRAWNSGAPLSYSLGMVGGPGGKYGDVMCPLGTFVAGWWIQADNLVHRLKVVCRNFRP